MNSSVEKLTWANVFLITVKQLFNTLWIICNPIGMILYIFFCNVDYMKMAFGIYLMNMDKITIMCLF